MVDTILKSDYADIKPVKEKTLPEYYLAKAASYAKSDKAKSYWLVDGISDEKRYFSKFDEETRKIASAFYKLGLRRGEVVIFMTRDLCKAYILLIGVWRANGVMRASYPDDDFETILARVKESNSKFIVCEQDALDLCKKVSTSVEWTVNVITVNMSTESIVPSLQQFLEEDDGAECPETIVTEDDPAIILCTSGSTGLPKGAVHTHKSFLYRMRYLELGPFLKHKPNLIATKATHVSGTVIGLTIMACGKTAVVVSNLTKDSIFDAVEKYKPGYVTAFPTFLVAMAEAHGHERDFSSIEVIFTAGVAVTPAIRHALHKLPNLKDTVVAYGMTETLLCTTSAVVLEDDQKDSLGIKNLPDFSVGKVYPGTQLQIRDPETLEILPPNQQGEICINTVALFHSYLNNKEATEKSYVDGYFRTGDVGYYDTQGFVYVVDRLKEIFKYYNDHISPTELENVIAKYPKVSEVCVVGIPDPGGHVPRAFVRVNAGHSSEPKELLAEEIKQFANEKLAVYKHLRGGLYIVDELPKGKTGKISRQLVQKIQVS